jgi:predicted double-glycine peptidase
MERTTRLPFLIATIIALSVSTAHAHYLNLGGGGGEYTLKTKSLMDRRFHKTVRQKFDFSCGSAAVATLLKYHYRTAVDERQVIQEMYNAGDQQKIEREGFSMLDMKTYLHSLGFESNGYKESLDKLTTVGIPAIVLINRNGYLHFVVVRGVTKDKVLLADPSLGTRVEDRKKFESQWNNILFVVTNKMDIARPSFNTQSAWNFQPRGRFENARLLPDLELARLTLDFTKSPNYY